MKTETWRRDFDRLWNELVPPEGQASTIQGELIRAAGRLGDEAYRNGNINFDKHYRLLCEFLRKHLNDPDVFTPAELSEIDGCVDRLLDAEHPDVRLSGSCHHILREKIVKLCKSKPDLRPHRHNPALRR
jgi:hypothetical protein